MKKIKGWGAVRDIILKSPLTVFFQNVIDSKGQLISKGLFGIFNSPKNERKNSTLLKVALSQKILENFYIAYINIPNHYPEQKI